MKTKPFATIVALTLLSTINSQLSTSFAQGTAFTYQGRLNDGGAPANGTYDFDFVLFGASSGGSLIGSADFLSAVPVANGLFTVSLDFGGNFPGAGRWLEISVRTNGSAGAYSTLAPRQEITPAPYAFFAANASNVVNGIWSLNGSSAYYDSGNVGIGTTTPARRLTVFSSLYGIEHTDGTIRLGTYLNGGGGWLGTISNHKLHFFVNDGTPSMTVDTTGNVGIGTTSPAKKLDIAGDSQITGQLTIKATSGAVSAVYPLLVKDSAGNTVFDIEPADVATAVNLVDMTGALRVTGNAFKSTGGTSWGVLSDGRLKQDVSEYTPGLDEVLQLHPVRFRYRDDPKRHLTSTHEEVGFIAQEVREVIPDAVAEDTEGYLSLKADPIHWAAINAIQELDAKLEGQRAENADLKQQLKQLAKIVNELNQKLIESTQ